MTTLPVPKRGHSADEDPIPLDDLGIQEIEPGIVESTPDNRVLLRRNGWSWGEYRGPLPRSIADQYPEGTRWQELPRLPEVFPANLIAGRRYEEKKPLLVDPDDRNSDYLAGPELLLELSALRETTISIPGWVIFDTQAQVKKADEAGDRNSLYDDRGDGTGYRHGVPVRCKYIKADGVRCWLWTGHPKLAPPFCRTHSHFNRAPEDSQRMIDVARAQLISSAPKAVDVLEELMLEAESEPVRLKASTEILDRAGVRGGYEVDQSVTVEQVDTSALIRERLDRLAGRLELVPSADTSASVESTRLPLESAGESLPEVVEAEVVEDE